MKCIYCFICFSLCSFQSWNDQLYFFHSETKDVSSSEELVLNTVATVNNLSFYNTKTSAINTLQVRVLEGKEGGATNKAISLLYQYIIK